MSMYNQPLLLTIEIFNVQDHIKHIELVCEGINDCLAQYRDFVNSAENLGLRVELVSIIPERDRV